MRRRAVIFDDNDLIRRMLWYFFDRRGYEVSHSLQRALVYSMSLSNVLARKTSSCAELIVSDVNMMGRNGLDYIGRLDHKGCKQRHFSLISGSLAMRT